ncbi:uncharacterized protein RCO7_02364 [Rhynchosporium graminicola]|uniref:Protein kinase domain-containing protein n=1 Tax=Rhynchosporium graminicola TaxID=2792576 RepID=A0A1E1JW32_9HELO|nr:uncharacterized protein RCO7_02364 [Rhynchosporium commune]
MDEMRRKIVSDEGCFASTFERQYYRKGDMFVKRCLRKSEYRTGYRGLYIPKLGMERLRNEAASLLFVQESTNVPVPRLYDHFDHDGAYYIAMEYIEGVCMSSLAEDQKEAVAKQIEIYLSTLHNLKSTKIGGPAGIIVPPYRIVEKTEDQTWNLPTEGRLYSFCHMDLSQHNVIVDPETLKINAIIDMEYSQAFGPNNLIYLSTEGLVLRSLAIAKLTIHSSYSNFSLSVLITLLSRNYTAKDIVSLGPQ